MRRRRTIAAPAARCLDICPTDAFPAPYQLDARRCIAYLTIEHKGPIPREFRAPIGNRVFGCDDCLAVCPWNKFAEAARETKLAARDGSDDRRRSPSCWRSTMPRFRALFAGTPVKRTGRDRFVRNVLIAAGNSGDGALRAGCRALLDDASPLVRGMAVWALSRLLPDRPSCAWQRTARSERRRTRTCGASGSRRRSGGMKNRFLFSGRLFSAAALARAVADRTDWLIAGTTTTPAGVLA